jgi:tRNA pseudouridine38-40 synthase
MRLRLTLEYDGSGFRGWAAQPGHRTVEGELRWALGRIFPDWGQLAVAGRTDAGVHARGQVAHFDLERSWDPLRLREGLNACLRPAPVSVLEVSEVGENFHARYSATRRHYRYCILNRRAPPALDVNRAWHVNQPLDDRTMHEAAQYLVGRHDFTTFRSAECQAASPLKTLDRLAVSRRGELIEIAASARSFLHNQVRSMVGSLKLVGDGKWASRDLASALAARDRTACGPVAPPHGLYLMAVDYD